MIEVQNINKSYGSIKVLENFSLIFEKTGGGVYFIKVPSVKVKTTLLNIIGAIENADSGKILYGGKKYKRMEDFKNTSFVFQNFGLLENETVLYNFTKFNIPNNYSRILAALKDVGLGNILNKKIYSLSGGEQQRVAIAKALLKDSNIILADEPTGNLDKKNSMNIIDILRSSSRDRLVIIVTHDLELIDESKGDKCIVL
ncbi:MAG: ABC transporter ATP-binding protein [Bacilli bacterium]